MTEAAAEFSERSKLNKRPSARLFVLDEHDRVLLFKFVFNDGALAGQIFWATPGGALDAGETFADAAKRELFEETGIVCDNVGESIEERQFVMLIPSGEQVFAHEKYFVVRTQNQALANTNWTAEESDVIAEHKWWHIDELRSTSDTVFPNDLADILLRLCSGSG